MEKQLNVYQKINEVKKTVKNFIKDKENTGVKYSYASGSQILKEIKTKMEELGLILLPTNIVERDRYTYDYTNSKGVEKTNFVVVGDITYSWINTDNPDDKLNVSLPFYGAQDDISKAFGSGLTYSERYFLLKSLGVPTDDDDPDLKDTNDTKIVKKPKYTKPVETPKQSTPNSTNGAKKTNYYVTIRDFISGSEIGFADVNQWLYKAYGLTNVKLNDLQQNQFDGLMNALSKKLNKPYGSKPVEKVVEPQEEKYNYDQAQQDMADWNSMVANEPQESEDIDYSAPNYDDNNLPF